MQDNAFQMERHMIQLSKNTLMFQMVNLFLYIFLSIEDLVGCGRKATIQGKCLMFFFT